MSGASDYLEAAQLTQILNTGKVWVGLYMTPPTDWGGGWEMSGLGYARVEVDSTTVAQWLISGTTQASNINAIQFPVATAGWGTMSAFGIFDAVTGGNLLIWDELLTAKFIYPGDVAEFYPGSLVIHFD